jgi:N-acetylglucosamine malate deacetylase 2
MSWQADQLSSGPSNNQFVEELVALRVLVLAAHPDDETIGASTVLARSRGCSVAYLTDGAPRDSAFWTGGRYASRSDYAKVRRDEAIRALRIAGVSGERIHWLEAVDQEAVFAIEALVERFKLLLDSSPTNIVITHPYEGGHPDHDTAALVAHLAIAGQSRRIGLFEMTSYHARDGGCVVGEFLACEPNVWEAIDTKTGKSRSALSEEDRDRKRRMLKEFISQQPVLKDFPVDRELLRRAPTYDFSQPPHEGKLWYECMRWPMTAKRWRELAAEATARVQEHSCH